MTTITDLSKRALDLAKKRDEKIAHYKAIAASDDMMNTRAKTEYVAGWTKAVRRDYDAAMAELKNDVAYVGRQLTDAAGRLRPTFDPNSAADLTRTEQAWRNNVLPELEKGRPLTAVLKNASRDDVLGAERFAPAYLRSTATPQSLQDHLGGAQEKDWSDVVARAATQRYADLIGGEDGETLRAADRVEQETGAFQRAAAATEYGSAGLDTAVDLHYATQSAPVDDATTDAEQLVEL